MGKAKFVLGLGVFLAFIGLAVADTGHEGATRIERGSYNGTRQITVDATGADLIAAASVKRPDMTCFNNTSVAVWIGSNTATTDLFRIGIPIASSATFTFDSYTGDVYGLCNSGTCDIRCWDGKVQ